MRGSQLNSDRPGPFPYLGRSHYLNFHRSPAAITVALMAARCSPFAQTSTGLRGAFMN